jgi:PAS domain S-box-containing protein
MDIREILKQKEESLRFQYKYFPVPAYTWRKCGDDFVLIDYNNAAEVITKGKIEYLLASKLSELYRERPEVIEAFWHCFEHKTNIMREELHMLKTIGEERSFFIHYVFVPPDLIVVYTDDITERRRIEELLRIKDTALEVSLDGFVIADMKGTITYVNDACVRMWGYADKSELIGRPSFEFWQDSDKFLAEREKWHKYGQYSGELVAKRKDGLVFDVGISAAIVKNNKGKSICVFGSCVDITEQKKMREILKQSEAKFRNLSEEITDGVIIAVESKNYWVNKAVSDIFGYSKEELIGKGMGFLVVDENLSLLVKKIRKQLEERSSIGRYEAVARRKDGEEIDIEFLAKKINFDNKDAVQIVIRDITERKKTEKALESAYKKLRQAQEEIIQSSKMAAIGQLASGISHELNQPLTGIKGFSQAILMDLEKTNPLRKDIEKILEQADRMAQIIKNVRFFARKADFKLEEIDLNQPIENALMFLSEQLRMHDILLNKILSDQPLVIKGDANQLQQVFLNVIANAREAIENASSKERRELMIKSFFNKDENRIEVIFQDSGCGICHQDLSNIFNPFFTTKSQQGGMGLGLSIAKRIIESHRGKIEVDSKEGEGTAFKITFPAAP